MTYSPFSILHLSVIIALYQYASSSYCHWFIACTRAFLIDTFFKRFMRVLCRDRLIACAFYVQFILCHYLALDWLGKHARQLANVWLSSLYFANKIDIFLRFKRNTLHISALDEVSISCFFLEAPVSQNRKCFSVMSHTLSIANMSILSAGKGDSFERTRASELRSGEARLREA